MEQSVNDGDISQPLHSPPRRRRSTFFERRDSFVPTTPGETNTNDSSKDTATTDNQALSSYYEQLIAEKDQWKREVNNRKNKYHDLRQQYQMAFISSGRSRISYSALTNEDIEFLKAKPNISKLVESQSKLHKSVKETRALYRRANELDDIIINDSEQKIKEITNYILEHSTVDSIE